MQKKSYSLRVGSMMYPRGFYRPVDRSVEWLFRAESARHHEDLVADGVKFAKPHYDSQGRSWQD